MPSHDISHVITESFKRVMNHHGFNWKSVTNEQKDAYFQDFKKFFYWDKDLKEEIVYKFWHKRAGERYKDLVHRIKKSMNETIPPPFIPVQEWAAWKAYWERDDVQLKATKARQNRKTEPDGEGTGISKHRGGSRSAVEYALQMAKERGVDIPKVQWQVFQRYHISDNGEFTNGRSRRITTQVEEKFQTLSQPVPGTDEVQEIDKTDVLKDVLGGLSKKKRLFGAGSLAHKFVSPSGTSVDSASTSQIDPTMIDEYNEKFAAMDEKLQMEKQQRQKMEAKMKELFEQFQVQLRAQQETFQRFIATSISGIGHPPSSSSG